jgi:phosphoglycerate dehydrogenase-like enzyme
MRGDMGRPMLRVAVLDDYQSVAERFGDWRRVQAQCMVEFFDRSLSTVDEAARALADFDIICLMRERMPVPAALIQRLPRLKLICVTGAHNRTLDLQAATARGIVVCHTENASTEHPTSELTWALILAAARRIVLENQRIRAGKWQGTVGQTLHGRILGLLGLGRVGKSVARIGAAFGMNLVAWSPNLTAERAAEADARLVSKSELFAESDVVTVHLVLGDRTRGIVGAAELALMRKDSILVNTSRGPLIQEAALIDALRERRPGIAALDTFDTEPLPLEHPFRSMDNVLATPHLGYVTADTYRQFYASTVENIEAFLAGQPIRLLRH